MPPKAWFAVPLTRRATGVTSAPGFPGPSYWTPSSTIIHQYVYPGFTIMYHRHFVALTSVEHFMPQAFPFISLSAIHLQLHSLLCLQAYSALLHCLPSLLSSSVVKRLCSQCHHLGSLRSQASPTLYAGPEVKCCTRQNPHPSSLSKN